MESIVTNEIRESGMAAEVVRVVVSLAMIGVGLFLVFASTPDKVADAVFVASIALALAVWLWPGASKGQARVISLVLVLLAAYAVVRGFGLFELELLRRLGGITAIVMGVILLIPVVRAWMARRSASSRTE
jgi:hypothetical protein